MDQPERERAASTLIPMGRDAQPARSARGSSPARTYVPSGEAGPWAALLGLIMGIAPAVLGGVLYQLALDRLRVAGVGLVFGATLGLMVGTAGGVGLRRGDTRSPRLAMLVLLCLAGLAVTSSWAAAYADDLWAAARQATTRWREVTAQVPLSSWLRMRLSGGHTIYGDAPLASSVSFTGPLALLLWLGEALLIGAVTVSVGLAQLSDPFCERCARWTTAQRRVQRRPELLSLHDVITQQLGEAATRLMQQGRAWVVHTIHFCPGCNRAAYLSSKLSARGSASEIPLAHLLEITDEQRAELLAMPMPLRLNRRAHD